MRVLFESFRQAVQKVIDGVLGCFCAFGEASL